MKNWMAQKNIDLLNLKLSKARIKVHCIVTKFMLYKINLQNIKESHNFSLVGKHMRKIQM